MYHTTEVSYIEQLLFQQHKRFMSMLLLKGFTLTQALCVVKIRHAVLQKPQLSLHDFSKLWAQLHYLFNAHSVEMSYKIRNNEIGINTDYICCFADFAFRHAL